jgi:hypothetical protein
MIKTTIMQALKNTRLAKTVLVGSILSGTNKYIGACNLNGLVYFAPWNGANQILEYNIATGISRNIGSVYTGAKKWVGCTPHSDGNIYFGMGEATQCLKYNPTTETTTLIGNTTYTGGDKFAGIVESLVNNKLYLTPFFSNQVLELDPVTGNTRLVGTTYAGSVYKWNGNGVTDGNWIYFCPNGYNQIMRYNVVTELNELVGSTYGTITNDFKWGRWTKLGRKLYASNQNRTEILSFDLDTQISSLIGSGLPSGSLGIESYKNNLYLIPHSNNRVYQFDILKNKGQFVGNTYNLTTERFIGSTRVGTDIFCTPFFYNQILNIKI